MTAHVVYADIDPVAPATTSLTVVRDVIRGSIGFSGLLMSDDISMEALSGPLQQRARAALAAGCDVVLHYNETWTRCRNWQRLFRLCRQRPRSGLSRRLHAGVRWAGTIQPGCEPNGPCS